MKKKRIILLMMLFVMIMLLGVGCTNGNGEPTEEDLRFFAKAFAEKVVTDRLKAPSTAKFSPYNETKITPIGDNTYIVEGYVDAENSFGGYLRTNYKVEIKIVSETKFGYKNLEFK